MLEVEKLLPPVLLAFGRVTTALSWQDRPALQLYQPGARIRSREGGGGTSVECPDGSRGEADDSAQGGSQKNEEAG